MKKCLIGLLIVVALLTLGAQTVFKIITYPQFPHTSTLNANDLILVWRGSTNYNITESEFANQMGITVTNAIGTNIVVNVAYITNLYSTTINAVTNINNYDFSTNIFATTINAVTNINNYDFTTNLFVTTEITSNLFVTNIFDSTAYITNLYSTNIYTTNLFATTVNAVTNINNYDFTTNLYATNIFATTVNAVTNISNFSFTTNLYTTNLFATTVNATTNISNFSYITNLYVTNLTVQNFQLTSNGYVLSFGGYGTNETWVGPTTFVDTNKSGVIDILDADGTTIVAGFDTNMNGFFGRGYAVSTNSWAGPTNVLSLGFADNYYTTFTPCSLTGVAGKLGAYSSGVSLSISNAASTNVTVYFASFTSSDGTRSAVLTNATVGIIWVKYSPVWGTTNLVIRPTFF